MLGLIDLIPGALLPRLRVIKGSRVEHHALAEALHHGEAIVQDCTLKSLHHVRHLGGVGAGDEGRAGGQQLFHGVDRTVKATLRVRLALATNGSGRTGLVLGQAVNEVVHDHVGQADVLPCCVVQVVPTDGEAVAITAKDEDVEVRAAHGKASGQRQRTTMDEVNAVAVHKVRETAAAPDTGYAHDLLMRHLEFLQHLVKSSQNGEVSAPRTPRRVVCGQDFLGEFLLGRC